MTGARSKAADAGSRTRPPAPFVVGVPRSGTTLLREMLNAHPLLAVLPETLFVPRALRAWAEADDAGADPAARFLELVTSHYRWADLGLDRGDLEARIGERVPRDAGAALRALYGLYAERAGKPRWGDKTPFYSNKMEVIERALPEARFIHLIRDGRAVALSVKDLWFGPDSIEDAARMWVERIGRAREQAPRLAHYMELRYEDLVRDPEPSLRRICEFIELDYDPRMLEYHRRVAERSQREPVGAAVRAQGTIPADARRAIVQNVASEPDPSRLDRWTRDLSRQDRDQFEAIGGDLLRELGYPVRAAAHPAPARGSRAHPPFTFIVSSGRSGTTLLRAMLDSHPRLAITPETMFITRMLDRRPDAYGAGSGFDIDGFLRDLLLNKWFRRWELPADEVQGEVRDATDFAEGIRAAYRVFARHRGADRYGDKTPGYIYEMDRLASLFEEARFVHLIRDGRAVAASFLAQGDMRPNGIAEAALLWRERVEAGRNAGRRLGSGRYLEVRYESLVEDPGATLRGVCEFIELDFDSAMLDYPQRAAELVANDGGAERHRGLFAAPTRGFRPWDSELTGADLETFELIAHDLLAELGYKPVTDADRTAESDATRILVAEVDRLRGEVETVEREMRLRNQQTYERLLAERGRRRRLARRLRKRSSKSGARRWLARLARRARGRRR